jgi:hypothetical protein
LLKRKAWCLFSSIVLQEAINQAKQRIPSELITLAQAVLLIASPSPGVEDPGDLG